MSLRGTSETSNPELQSKPDLDLGRRLGFPTQQHKISYTLVAIRD